MSDNLDDFRQQADEGSLFEDDDPLDFNELGDFDQEYEDFEDETSEPVRPNQPFLGLTPAQRLILSGMLLVLTCVFSFLILLVTEKIVI